MSPPEHFNSTDRSIDKLIEALAAANFSKNEKEEILLSFRHVTGDVSKERQLGVNPHHTHEQTNRDRQITRLLRLYVDAYEKKAKQSKLCRWLILGPCLLIILGFAVLLAICSCHILSSKGGLANNELLAFITACVSFISLVIGLLTIITKYFFPENDEQYITAVVESIQHNDLEDKKVNLHHDDDETEEGR